ncbi:MAG: hypothetical protein HYY18_14270 [Planctomycetes bacterium]|nr:hypothetical protein [Planctomycetota bacterium]
MTAAPTGQVSLVCTDLQGSTELWEKLGSKFQPVLEQHHRMLRARTADVRATSPAVWETLRPLLEKAEADAEQRKP